MQKTIIIGAGISGLSCAYHLRSPYVILEKEKTPGGLCRSLRINGYTFDYSGHFIHLHSSYGKKVVSSLLKDNLLKIDRKAFIQVGGVYVPYPFQANLYYLPDKIRRECYTGFMRKQKLKHRAVYDPSFYQWSLGTFGKGITKYFMKPYNEKLWTVSSRELTADWVAPFVPRPTQTEIHNSMKNGTQKTFGYNASFYYPTHGGAQALINSFSTHVKNLTLKSTVHKIDTRKKCVETLTGKRLYYDHIVSTQPLPELITQLHTVPSDVEAAANVLRWNSVSCINIGIKKEHCNENALKGMHWVYYPEKKYIFYRTGIYTNINPALAPKGCVSFYVEISHRKDKNIDNYKTLRKVIDDLQKCRLIESDDIDTVNWLTIPYAYVIYDKNRTHAVKTIQRYLKKEGIYSIGRYGAWEYSFIEKSILEGKETARLLEWKK